MAIFKLDKQDRDYYDLQELLKPKEEQEKSSGIGTKPSNQEQDDEGLFSGFFGGLFDRSRQQAKELSVLAEEEAIRSALEIRLMRQAAGITSSKAPTGQLSDQARDAMFSSSDMRGTDLTMKDNAREAQEVVQPMITPVSRGEQPEMADSPAPVDAPSVDTRSNEMLDKAIQDVLETVVDSDVSDSTDSADGGAAPSGGKGIMSPRLDGKDGDIAAYDDPFTITEDELYDYAKEAFPDNDLAAGALLATIEAESASGDSMLESGNYTKEAALKAAYQGKYKTARKKEVEKIFKDSNLTYVDSDGNTRMTKEGQVKFFNIYYNDKYRGEDYKMGNTEEGDGFRFRGRGPIQLTGKNNYKKYGDMIGVDLVQNPQLVITDKDVALAVTKAYMKDKGLDKVTSASKLRNLVGHVDDSKATKAKARWKRAKDIEKEITLSRAPRPKARPDTRVASN